MNPAFISAFSALAGTIVGGLTSFATTWFTQRAQLQNADLRAQKVKLETLYNDFIAEAARLFVDALTHQSDDPTKMVTLYALLARMRLISARAVVDAATRIEDAIQETYLGTNHTLHEVRDVVSKGGMKHFLIDFSEACREDLTLREP